MRRTLSLVSCSKPASKRRRSKRLVEPQLLYGKGESLLRHAEVSDGIAIPGGSITTIAATDVVPLFETASAPLLFTHISSLRDRYLFTKSDVAEIAKAAGVMAPALLQVCPWFDMGSSPQTAAAPQATALPQPEQTGDITTIHATTSSEGANGDTVVLPSAITKSAFDLFEERCQRRRNRATDHSSAELQVQDPSKWVMDVERSVLPESVQEWEDVLFTLSNHPCFLNGGMFMEGHKALLSLVEAYCSFAEVVAWRARADSQPSSLVGPKPFATIEWGSSEAHGGGRGGSRSAIRGRRVLQTPFSPRLLRKLRQKYLSMQRVQEFSGLFRAVVGVEHHLIDVLQNKDQPANNSSPWEQLLVPSVGCDSEHLVFFSSIHGRRECGDLKSKRWEDTLSNVRTAVPLALAISPPATPTSQKSFATAMTSLAKVTSNVCMFLANDNAEEHRAVGLIRAVCDATQLPPSGAVPLDAIVAFVDALYTAAIDKLRVTKGASLASTLCVVSLTQTCRHILRLTPNGVTLPKKDADLLRADFTVVSLTVDPATVTAEGNTSAQGTPVANERMLKLDMLERSGLALLAPIRRHHRAHVEMLASAVRDVLQRLADVAAGRGRKGFNATTGQCKQVLEWIDAQVRLCTPIPMWTDVQELRTVVGSAARTTVRYSGGGSDEEGFAFKDAILTSLLEAGCDITTKERSFVWTCGCGSANPIEKKSCWSCAANAIENGRKSGTPSHVAQCRSCASIVDAPACTKCAAPHPRDAALQNSKLWFCEECSSVTSTAFSKCDVCKAQDPTKVPHSCPGCGVVTIGSQPLLCKTCGWSDAAKNVRLWVCPQCDQMAPIASSKLPMVPPALGKDVDGSSHLPPLTQCARCSAEGGKMVMYNPREHRSFNAFQWECGCGTLNAPTTLKCRKCTATTSSSQPALTHTCTSCSHLAGVTTKHRGGTLAGMCFCSVCRSALHPRDATLVARRLTVCPACHGITSTASEKCQHCSSQVPASLTRFLPTFADLPWSCHSCGGVNHLQMQDGESGLVCSHCEVDRISPLLFSQFETWDCLVCGQQGNYGFFCGRCRTLHSSVSAAEVPLWTCSQCKRHNYSWEGNCANTKCNAARPHRPESQVRYLPWECPQCQFHNGPQMTRSCGRCRAVRPQPDVCGLCGDRHLSYLCSHDTESSSVERLERLKQILLAAAMGDDATAKDDLNDEHRLTEMFISNPPPFEFEESPLFELPMTSWM